MRLLESLGAQVVRLVINTLAGQTLYATLTLSQGEQTHNIDVRLSDALALALRTDAPLYTTKALLENELDLNSQITIPDQQELLEQAKNMQQMKREERLQLEESLRQAQAEHQRKKQVKSLELLWPFLLEESTNTRDGISVAELSALDPLTTFQPREISLEGQNMTALRIPNDRESAWVLVRPEIWEELTHRLQNLQKPEPSKKDIAKHPIPDPLPAEMKQKAEAHLIQLVANADLRTVLLLNANSELIAWQGPDDEATLHSFIAILKADMIRHAPLANEQELHRQLGHQPQMASLMGGNKKAILQTLPTNIGGLMVSEVSQGWKMVVIFAEKPARDLGEEVRQLISQTRRTLAEILSEE